jgi:hypothetical protein
MKASKILLYVQVCYAFANNLICSNEDLLYICVFLVESCYQKRLLTLETLFLPVSCSADLVNSIEMCNVHVSVKFIWDAQKSDAREQEMLD